MGKVEKFVKKQETEKHKNTEEFIATLFWYIESMNKVLVDFVEASNNISEAFNAKMAEIKTEAGGK